MGAFASNRLVLVVALSDGVEQVEDRLRAAHSSRYRRLGLFGVLAPFDEHVVDNLLQIGEPERPR